MSEVDDKSLPPWVRRLRGFFEAAGETLPEEIANSAPFVYIDTPPDEWAHKVIELLRGRDVLFRRGKEIGTVDEMGEWEAMDANRFRTWLPAVAGVVPFRKQESDGMPIKCGIDVSLATAILRSDELRAKLPEIRAINLVRLPAVRASVLDERGMESRKGFKKYELLPVGYDRESRTYTVHQSVDIDENMDPSDAFKFWRDLLKYFEFSDPERLAVQMAAQLTIFCRGLYGGRSPMFLWNSNLPGSGKSRLSQLCLDPIYGDAGKSGYSYDSREEVRKELNAAATAFSPYIWFDDVPKGMIRNVDLNRWLTAKTWQCREIGTGKLFKGPLYAATFMTGAQIELDDMIARRTLVIDLFPRRVVRNRVLPPDATMLNDAFFECEEMRSKILSSMWALVRLWDDLGRPCIEDIPATKGERPLESFESWSAVIPAIVAAANFGNCLKTFEAPDAGNTETKQFSQLAEILIREHAVGRDSGTVTMEDVIRACRLNDLFIDHLGSADDVLADLERNKRVEWKLPQGVQDLEGEAYEKAAAHHKRFIAAGYSDKSLQSSWGKRFRKSAVAGQWFDVAGDVWQFASRASSRGTRFPITKVKP